MITPDGTTAYTGTAGTAHDRLGTLIPVSTATNTAGPPIDAGVVADMAITPDGKTLYILDRNGEVVPVSTATNTPGKPINLGAPPTEKGSSISTPARLASRSPPTARPFTSLPTTAR